MRREDVLKGSVIRDDIVAERRKKKNAGERAPLHAQGKEGGNFEGGKKKKKKMARLASTEGAIHLPVGKGGSSL